MGHGHAVPPDLPPDQKRDPGEARDTQGGGYVRACLGDDGGFAEGKQYLSTEFLQSGASLLGGPWRSPGWRELGEVGSGVSFLPQEQVQAALTSPSPQA